MTERAAGEGATVSVRERLRGLVVTILAERGAEARFTDDDVLAEIGIASVEMVSLLLAVESAFDIEVPQEEITTDVFRSIATLAAMIGRLCPDLVAA